MHRFAGKRLLVLGSNVSADEVVRYARSHGALTYVADYYPIERSRAKQECDVPLQVSTADLDALGSIIESEGIDGVFSGISEFNLLQALALSEKHHLPFYCTREQWDAVESKDNFRSLCEKYEVPCPTTFYAGGNPREIPWDDLRYPVVLKPVDAASSTGVFFCANKDELAEHIRDSQAVSSAGRIIVESFEKGDEFTAHYTICGGEGDAVLYR